MFKTRYRLQLTNVFKLPPASAYSLKFDSYFYNLRSYFLKSQAGVKLNIKTIHHFQTDGNLQDKVSIFMVL